MLPSDNIPSLGQKLPVSIYKLTVLDTVEQRILEVCREIEPFSGHFLD